jgi:hypothetical protein
VDAALCCRGSALLSCRKLGRHHGCIPIVAPLQRLRLVKLMLCVKVVMGRVRFLRYVELAHLLLQLLVLLLILLLVTRGR